MSADRPPADRSDGVTTPLDAVRDAGERAFAGRRGGVFMGCAFLALSFVWMIGLGIVTAVAVFLVAGPAVFELGPNASTADILELGPGWLIPGSTFLQFLGLGAIVVFLWWISRWKAEAMFALRRPHAAAIAAGVFGGLVVGTFPGWIAEQLMDKFPGLDGGNLELINGLIADSGPVSKVLMLVSVCVFAPVFEELIFRGLIFDAVERAANNKWAAFVVSSVLFALYHGEPIHVIAVLFTGFFLGWLRLRSRSIVPGILAHAVNNGLAAIVAIALGTEAATETGVSLPLSLGAAALTVVMAVVVTVGEPKDTPAEAPS